MPPGKNIPTALMPAYRDLVRIAHLVLAGRGSDQERLHRAHRIVATALPRRGSLDGDGYAALRVRVLRRALRPRRWWEGGRTWLRMLPATGFSSDIALCAALSELSPPGRAAYALTHLDGLSPGEVRAVLVHLGVADPDAAAAEAQSLGQRLEMTPQQQVDLLERPPFDPTIARVYGRPAPLLLRAAPLLALLLAVPLIASGLPERVVLRTAPYAVPAAAVSATQARTLPAETWRERFRLDLTAWETRGDLAQDEALINRALRAWQDVGDQTARGGAHRGVSAAAPAVPPLLVFAGEVDGRRVVLLHDEPRLARYVEHSGQSRIDVHPEPGNGVADWPAIRLTETDEGARFLLPPWVSESDTAELTGSAPRWRELETTDGVTAPVPAVREEGCARGPVLRLRAPEVAHGQPYTLLDLGSIGTAHIGYMPPPPAEIRRLGPHELTADPAGFALWADLACALTLPGGPAETATAWEFATTELPDGGTGRWVCTRFGFPDGTGTAELTLLSSTGRDRTVDVGTRENGWDCSNLSRQIVAGTWWQEDSGRWHYLAAGSRDTASLSVEGAAEGTASGPHLAVPGPQRGPRPEGRTTVTGLNSAGQEMTVFD